eukprot:1141859-Pelagomonas_calceolata.AAC.2
MAPSRMKQLQRGCFELSGSPVHLQYCMAACSIEALDPAFIPLESLRARTHTHTLSFSLSLSQGGPDPRPTPGPTPGPSPKPPQPEPVQCDSATSCPPETTCCCVTDFLGMCLEWGCCPVMDAVCCDDHEHCCTPELPVCDTESGRCGTGEANGATQPWLTKIPATRHWPRWVPWSHAGSGSGKKDRRGQW